MVTTTSTYVHMFQEAQARTSDVIEKALNFSKRKNDDQQGETRKDLPAWSSKKTKKFSDFSQTAKTIPEK